jgi:hypothetical protein
MTPTGATILGICSLIISIVLAVKDLKKMTKDKSNGWTFIGMIVVIVYLVNVI